MGGFSFGVFGRRAICFLPCIVGMMGVVLFIWLGVGLLVVNFCYVHVFCLHIHVWLQ